MPKFTAGGKQLEADLLVFDKDGLMFDSEQFWIELVNERCGKLLRYLSPEEVVRWARLMGADTVPGEGGEAVTTYVDPLGICACAAPREEISITASFLVSVKGWPWHQARAAAEAVFDESNQTLNLRKALRPQPGFVALMRRLRELDMPYGVATSDTLERTKASMELYGAWDKVRFVITPEDVVKGKPAPDMLIRASEITGVPLERIAMVGDSIVDVRMAEAAQSIGIGVSTDPEMRKRMKPHAAAVLNSLEELVF
ncbi:MAG: HAD family hydrolase [Lachnospiraceae bacterium]|nr:HAD family hydrolase [Lachnospiraceae bacterium]